MKTIIIIQARMNSTRLPGKVMLKLGDKTVIEHVIERLRPIPAVDEIWLATSDRQSDDILVEEANRCGAHLHRGSESDVLDRYYQTAIKAKADRILRVTSDCPFIDTEVVMDLIDLFEKDNCDYASNTINRTFPRGLDCEIFTMDAMVEAWGNASLEYQREHVTPYLYQNPQLFSVSQLTQHNDYSNYRWTLDTIEDWEFIQTVFRASLEQAFPLKQERIVDFLSRHPNITAINAHIEQKKLEE